MIFSGMCANFVSAQNKEEQYLNVDYSKFNSANVRVIAEDFFQKAINSNSDEEKLGYLNQAAAQYYILTNIDKSDLYAYVQLARIYDMQNDDSYAKGYFFRALGINSKNANANYYFGEFYYKRNQFRQALAYYQKALQYGKRNEASIYKNIGQIYERFGDLPRANYYYKKCIELSPDDSELFSKINDSVKNEYEQSGYYKRRLRK